MNIYDFKVKDTQGNEVAIEKYKGKVLLIVNTATGCGLTLQYEALEGLYQKYNLKGFEILDFPCNQFLNQAPGTNNEVAQFCKLKYNTTFQTFAKIKVNGKEKEPLYAYLREQQPKDIGDESTAAFLKKLKDIGQEFVGSSIKWNFAKFLVNSKGEVVARYSPNYKPENLEKAIENLLE